MNANQTDSRSENQNTENMLNADSNLRGKLQALTDNDIAEYYRLKTMEERYKKADEILGKIMTIFLADLGIRVSEATLAQAKNGAEVRPGSSPSPLDLKNTTDANRVGMQSKKAEAAGAANWVAAEKLRDEVRSDGEIADFLEKTRIENLDEAIRTTTAFSNKFNNLSVLKGPFRGAAQVKVSGVSHDWTIEMHLNAEIESGTLQGKTQIKIAENGEVFSDLTDNGEINNYREFSSGSEAVMMKASPSTYFQVYYIKRLDALVGNVYTRKSEADPFVRIGTLHLKRSG